jgi:hypothetical protein
LEFVVVVVVVTVVVVLWSLYLRIGQNMLVTF